MAVVEKRKWSVRELREIGKQFEAARGDRSQAAMARRAGVSQKTWERIESGRDSTTKAAWPPRPKTVVKVCKALGLDVRFYLDQYGFELPASEEYEVVGETPTYEEIKSDWEALQEKMAEFLGELEE